MAKGILVARNGIAFSTFFFIPFLGGNHLALPYITIDRFWIETSFMLLLISSITATYLVKRTGSHFVAFLSGFTPFLVISAVSLVYTWNTYNSIKELNLLAWVLGAVFLYSSVEDKTPMLRGLIWGAVFSVFCAVLQLMVLFPQLNALFQDGRYAMIMKERAVPFSAYINENMFGGSLLLILPIALLQGFSEKKIAYMLASLIICTGILLSLSRLSLIIMILELVTVAILLVKGLKFTNLFMLLAASACALLLFFVIAYMSPGGQAKERGMQQLVEMKTKTAFSHIKTLDKRTEIWKNGMHAFSAKPVLGYGAGVFEYAYRRHFDGGFYTRYAHSGAVKILVELGVLGLLAFLAYLFLAVKGMRKSVFSHPALAMATLCGLLFIAVDYALDIPCLVITFFVLSSSFFVPNIPRWKGVSRLSFFPVVLLLICSFAFTARANLSSKAIENGMLFEENGLVDQAYLSYAEADQLMPLDNVPFTRIVRIAAKKVERDSEPAKKESSRKILNYYLNRVPKRGDRDSEMLFACALGYGASGDIVKANEYMGKALELYPSSPYYASKAAEWYIRSGQLEKAHNVLRDIEFYARSIRQSLNPNGLYIYRIRDLEAEIAYVQGHTEQALHITEGNLVSARTGEFVITSMQTRELVQPEWLVKYLEGRASFYRAELKKRDQGEG